MNRTAILRRLWILVLALAVNVCAAAKPNFSGTWKLVVNKSDYGPFPPPSSMTRKVEHEEPNLRTVTTQVGQQGEVTTELTYTTDGKESINVIRGSETKGTAKWDVDALLIESKRQIQGMEVKFTERWTLSEDGKTLHNATHLSSAQGEIDLKLVFEKQ